MNITRMYLNLAIVVLLFYPMLSFGKDWRFPANKLLHQTGRKEQFKRDDATCCGWSANTILDMPGYLTYGPYINVLPEGKYAVHFTLFVDNNSADNLVVASIDVYDSTVDKILDIKHIRRKEFDAPFTEKIFSLYYQQLAGHTIEFRTYFHRTSYLFQRDVVVQSPDAPKKLSDGFCYDEMQITAIYRNGIDHCKSVYLVANCGKADGVGVNIHSYDSFGGVMNDSSDCSCEGSPFSFDFTELSQSRLWFRATFGPAQRNYDLVNLAFDFEKDFIDSFQFDGDRYYLNDAKSPIYKSGDTYNNIPKVYDITGLEGDKNVGVAKIKSHASWGEVTGPYGAVRITITNASPYSLHFHHHDGTNNMDIQFGRVEYGDTVFVEGEIVISDGTAILQNENDSDLNVVGDYLFSCDLDNDSQHDKIAWRSSDGTWFYKLSSENFQIIHSTQWGLPNDIPFVDDFNGDRITDFVVYRENGDFPIWALLYDYTKSWGATDNYEIKQWGLKGDIPVPADFNKDGKAEITVWRSSEGNWYVLNSGTFEDNDWYVVQWGLPEDKPFSADIDNDGFADMCVWRNSTKMYYFIPSSGSCPAGTQQHRQGCETDSLK
ncbi:MAG: VCBS repeat-containing protein [Candidatus Brocadia sp.]|nr:MAG: VCBS repeat-containing protein [Candidatus Brocadia sp.]